MWTTIATVILALTVGTLGRRISVSQWCSTDLDRTQLGSCVRPWLNLWELLRSHEAAHSELVFPLFYYSQDSYLQLCDSYLQSRDTCLTDSVLARCHNDSMVTFVESHMRFFCGEKSVELLTKFECLMKAVTAQPKCRDHIRGIPLPSHQASKCRGMPAYRRCIGDRIDEECGESALTLLDQSIVSFGCNTVNETSTELIDLIGDELTTATTIGVTDRVHANTGVPPVDTIRGRGLILLPANGQTTTATEAPKLTTIIDSDDNNATKTTSFTKLFNLPTKVASRGPGLVMFDSDGATIVFAEHESLTEQTTTTTNAPTTTAALATTTNATTGNGTSVIQFIDLPTKSNATRGPGLIMIDDIENSNTKKRPKTVELKSTAAAAHVTAKRIQLSNDFDNDLTTTALPTTTTDAPGAEELLSGSSEFKTRATASNGTEFFDLPTKSNSTRGPGLIIIDDIENSNTKKRRKTIKLKSSTGTVTLVAAAHVTAKRIPPSNDFDNDLTTTTSTTTAPATTKNATTSHGASVNEFSDLPPESNTTRGPGLIMIEEVENGITKEQKTTAKPKSTTVATAHVTAKRIPLSNDYDNDLTAALEEFYENISEEAVTKKQVSTKTDGSITVPNLPDIDEGSGEGPLLEKDENAELDNKSSECDATGETQIQQCFTPLSNRLGKIHERNPSLRNVLFPLFNYTVGDLIDLCEILQVTLSDCLDSTLLQQCSTNSIIQHVNSILGFACGPESTDFFLTYDCLHHTMRANMHCFDLIPGRVTPGMPKPEQCSGIADFYDCMETPISAQCTPESLRTFLRAVLNLGCTVGTKNGAGGFKKRITTSETSTSKSTTFLPPPKKALKKPGAFAEVQAKTEEENVISKPVQLPALPALPSGTGAKGSPSTGPPAIPGPPATKAPPSPRSELNRHIEESNTLGETDKKLPSDCTSDLQKTVRNCLSPLMDTWTGIRSRKPLLNNISFPIYKYNRDDLLELCDGYANAFLCGGFQPFEKCLDDPFVRFTNSHLGYICSPQNIQAFMQHYDCIMKVVTDEKNAQCITFIMGPSLPGQDANKCSGVFEFHQCITPDVRNRCRVGAEDELRITIRQFGCEDV